MVQNDRISHFETSFFDLDLFHEFFHLPCMKIIAFVEIISSTQSTRLVLELTSYSDVSVVARPQEFQFFVVE